MKKQVDVSVIVATKNEEKNISRCLSSIRNQDFKGKIEIVVVDNFSEDKTVEIAKKYTDHVLVKGPERSSQRNFGAANSSGQYFLFLDADMNLTKSVVTECVNLTKQSDTSPIIAITEKGKGYNFWGRALALEKNCYFKGPTWIIAARFFPKSLFISFKGYDSKLNAGEDWDLTQRIESAGHVMLLTKSHLIHHEQNISLFSLFKKEAYYIENIEMYAKRHPLAFSYQGSFLYRGLIWARSWRQLVEEPVLSLGFLSYKLAVWIMWQVKTHIL